MTIPHRTCTEHIRHCQDNLFKSTLKACFLIKCDKCLVTDSSAPSDLDWECRCYSYNINEIYYTTHTHLLVKCARLACNLQIRNVCLDHGFEKHVCPRTMHRIMSVAPPWFRRWFFKEEFCHNYVVPNMLCQVHKLQHFRHWSELHLNQPV